MKNEYLFKLFFIILIFLYGCDSPDIEHQGYQNDKPRKTKKYYEITLVQENGKIEKYKSKINTEPFVWYVGCSGYCLNDGYIYIETIDNKKLNIPLQNARIWEELKCCY